MSKNDNFSRNWRDPIVREHRRRALEERANQIRKAMGMRQVRVENPRGGDPVFQFKEVG